MLRPHSEVKFPSHSNSRSYTAGYASRLELKVKPIDETIPIDTLYFKGMSGVRRGDYISAKIPKYKTESVYVHPVNIYDDGNREFYFDRPFNTEESAIELKILSKDKKVLRTDKSVDYDLFEKRD